MDIPIWGHDVGTSGGPYTSFDLTPGTFGEDILPAGASNLGGARHQQNTFPQTALLLRNLN